MSAQTYSDTDGDRIVVNIDEPTAAGLVEVTRQTKRNGRFVTEESVVMSHATWRKIVIDHYRNRIAWRFVVRSGSLRVIT